jgi:hypothetical protein
MSNIIYTSPHEDFNYIKLGVIDLQSIGQLLCSSHTELLASCKKCGALLLKESEQLHLQYHLENDKELQP